MSVIRNLSVDEIEMVSGGNANSNYERNDHSSGSTSYGGQANGFQPNYAASGYGLLDGISRDCLTSLGLGAANAVAAGAARSMTGLATAAASALSDVGKTCNW